ncbi:hypothetical protein [Polaromonas sp.]|uniref:hypothetical protein n=1 Tax=Polaromonas sp. TaxID=1869339 RepID=UPI001831663F|nr:hypothetical protein [Polaromonas sp.]NMM05403.1 hypothetical protein [Polaromonas sp.]
MLIETPNTAAEESFTDSALTAEKQLLLQAVDNLLAPLAQLCVGKGLFTWAQAMSPDSPDFPRSPGSKNSSGSSDSLDSLTTTKESTHEN